jgi:hypothetical protein
MRIGIIVHVQTWQKAAKNGEPLHIINHRSHATLGKGLTKDIVWWMLVTCHHYHLERFQGRSTTAQSGKVIRGKKKGHYRPFQPFSMKQGQGAMCWTYEGSHMKECPNKGKIFTSKPTSWSIENYEHCGVNGHYIDNDSITWQISWTSTRNGSHVLRLGCRSCGEFEVKHMELMNVLIFKGGRLGAKPVFPNQLHWWKLSPWPQVKRMFPQNQQNEDLQPLN